MSNVKPDPVIDVLQKQNTALHSQHELLISIPGIGKLIASYFFLGGGLPWLKRGHLSLALTRYHGA
jgi:hypothetical protein